MLPGAVVEVAVANALSWPIASAAGVIPSLAHTDFKRVPCVSLNSDKRCLTAEFGWLTKAARAAKAALSASSFSCGHESL